MTEFEERRPFSRIHFNAPAEVSQGALVVDAEVLDISLKGALLAVPDNTAFDINSSLYLDIRLSGSVDIAMQGRIAHREPGRIGVACETIGLESIQHLRRLVELNVGDPAIMERELSELIHAAGP